MPGQNVLSEEQEAAVELIKLSFMPLYSAKGHISDGNAEYIATKMIKIIRIEGKNEAYYVKMMITHKTICSKIAQIKRVEALLAGQNLESQQQSSIQVNINNSNANIATSVASSSASNPAAAAPAPNVGKLMEIVNLLKRFVETGWQLYNALPGII